MWAKPEQGWLKVNVMLRIKNKGIIGQHILWLELLNLLTGLEEWLGNPPNFLLNVIASES